MCVWVGCSMRLGLKGGRGQQFLDVDVHVVGPLTVSSPFCSQGKLDPCVGRKKQIERVIQILGRRTKNNPCLIGEQNRLEARPLWRSNGNNQHAVPLHTHIVTCNLPSSPFR